MKSQLYIDPEVHEPLRIQIELLRDGIKANNTNLQSELKSFKRSLNLITISWISTYALLALAWILS